MRGIRDKRGVLATINKEAMGLDRSTDLKIFLTKSGLNYTWFKLNAKQRCRKKL